MQRWCEIVPMSPTGTTGSFLRRLWCEIVPMSPAGTTGSFLIRFCIGGLARDATWRKTPCELPQQHHHFRAAPEAAMFVVCKIQEVLQTVSLSLKTQIKGQALKWPGRATAGDQSGCCAPVFRREVTKWKCSTCQFSVSYGLE